MDDGRVKIVTVYGGTVNKNGHLHIKMRNLDVYVTGSNSRFLSSDIVTEFRGRGDELRVYPLSFSEFYSVYDGDFEDT